MKDRRKSLGGSDANRIMRGDWHTLWLEKTGRKEPEDLSENLPVQIGLATEDVNNKFFTLATGLHPVNDENASLKNVHQFMTATYDGVIMEEDVPIEYKHTNSNNTLDNCISTYMTSNT